jgi:hypothetical protein
VSGGKYSKFIVNDINDNDNDIEFNIAHLYMWIYSKVLYMCELTDC